MTTSVPALSVIVPCLNEAERLPLLLADLGRWNGEIERIVVDGGSDDATAGIARLAGACCVGAPRRGRGAQLAHGARQATAPWLLFLHADSRLNHDWPMAVEAVISKASTEHSAWFFDLHLNPRRPALRLLECAVSWRSRWLQRPYGDQGLLLHRQLYTQGGGFAPLPLMEDLDFVLRLAQYAQFRPIGQTLESDARRWDGISLIKRSWCNFRLRQRWRQGDNPDQLAREYYGPAT